jgi:hypothetical protein
MRRGLRLKRMGVVMAAAMAFGAVAVPQAPALDLGALEVDIKVDTATWGACGLVRDSLTSARYTAVLTAAGYESTGVARNGVIADQASHSGNPASPCTSGGFDSSVAAVVYTLTWTSVLGTTGTMTKVCVETPPVYTDSEIRIDPPVATASDSGLAIPPTTVARAVCSVT